MGEFALHDGHMLKYEVKYRDIYLDVIRCICDNPMFYQFIFHRSLDLVAIVVTYPLEP